MATDSKLVKTILYKSLSEGVYRDVVTKSSSYYYFLGQTLSWGDENNPPLPVDSLSYEHDVRNEIITIKEIKPSDIAFVIPRYDWAADVVYDMYDDRYSDEVLGVNVISGGAGYINIDEITLNITGGGGSGATAVVSEIASGQISGIILTSAGRGYTTEPTVNVVSPSGTGANLQAVIGISSTGKQKLEDSSFYVVTDEYNVYKCLDNNNGAYSRYKPTGTQLEPITTLDGYVWKFMYNIPINLRNKFYTDEYIPVVSALTNHFYSNGTIDNIYITGRGEGYSTALVSVTGDGYRESDPIYITAAQVIEKGTAYTNPTIEFSPPFTTASPYVANSNVNLGQIIFNSTSKDYYEVITPGQLGSTSPTHRDGTVLSGTAALKYKGTTLKGTITKANIKNITEINLTNAGIQYTSAPTVNIVDSTGVGATAISLIGTSVVNGAVITNAGNNYVAPQLTVVGGGGTGALINATVSGGHITGITVVSGGVGYNSVPSIVIEDAAGTGGVITAVLSGSPVLGIAVTNGGEGYSDPTVNITGTGTITTLTNSKTVTGVGTSFTTQAQSGKILKKTDGTYIGTVETVVSNTSLTLYNNASVAVTGQGFKVWTGPTVTITGGGGAAATAVAVVETGVIDHVTLNGGLREVVIINAGSGYIQAPEVTITGGGGQYAVVRSKLYADRVISTHVINSGENYTSAPTVTFGIPWSQGLEVYTNDQFSYGTFLYTVLEEGVFGHVPPTWTSGTQYTSVPWAASTLVTAGQTVYRETSGVKRLYEILSTGYTSTTPPTFTSGDGLAGTYGVGLRYKGKVASLRKDGAVATGYAVLRYGAGYSVNPEVYITDSTGTGGEINFLTTKSEAKISAITDNGQLVYLVVDDPGIGYTKATMNVSGDGTGASLVADLSLGAISSQQANNEILTPAGTIDAIAIVSGGYSYGVANISIQGDGIGAAAEAVIDPITNAITKINITNRGEGYTYADIQVIGNGYAAQLRPIISPYGGHGKNSPEELFARSLMFYTNISNDLNQGVIVGNDYRQVGILKDPRVFDGFERYQGSVGSACFIIQAPINVSRFSRDDELYIERTFTPDLQWTPSLQLDQGEFVWYADRIYTVVVAGLGGSTPPTTTLGSETNGLAVLTYVGSTKSKKKYRIISFSTSYALVQSLDSDIPEANDVFIKTSNITDNFTAISVGLPNFDKFSGQMMYIDNKQGFTPSGDETITLRTIIQF